MNPGGLLDKTEIMFAQWSGSNKQPKTGASALDIPSRPAGAKADYEVRFGCRRLTYQVNEAILHARHEACDAVGTHGTMSLCC